MSHIEEGTTNLVFADVPELIGQGDHQALAQHPCLTLLRQATALVAQQYEGTVTASYQDYWGKAYRTSLGLAICIPRSPHRSPSQALPRGLGVDITSSGQLVFRGDLWEVDANFCQDVQHALVQKYIALATLAALRQMGYQVTSEEEAETGRILITGVSYA
jgi:hypothetical protein